MWVRRCVFRFPSWLNALLHCVHWYGFSPVWVRRCVVRSLELANALLHCVYWSVWVRRCVVRLCNMLNILLQCIHWYGFFPVLVLESLLWLLIFFSSWCFDAVVPLNLYTRESWDSASMQISCYIFCSPMFCLLCESSSNVSYVSA